MVSQGEFQVNLVRCIPEPNSDPDYYLDGQIMKNNLKPWPTKNI